MIIVIYYKKSYVNGFGTFLGKIKATRIQILWFPDSQSDNLDDY